MNSQNLHDKSALWHAPSNIALVKYWGKLPGVQIPANPSVSLTLSQAKTKAKITVLPKREPWIELFFEGQKMPSFVPKIEKFFGHVGEHLSWLNEVSFKLETSNSFPHSAGIASSASSMAALSCCLVELDDLLHKRESTDFYERASFFSRLGSGSACRSLFAHAASWGKADSPDSFSSLKFVDERATAIEIHEKFKSMYDTIFVVSSKEKKVSSRAGHGLMSGNPYAKARFSHALENWNYALGWLKEGEWDHLGSLVEEEALTLHAMMMASRPGYLLMEPDTITLIHKVREFRSQTGHALYFTLDAGPNLHLLYPEEEREACYAFINQCQKELGGTLIDDRVGLGPMRGNHE